ncbi:hypothetical protein GWK47_007674 [Chionoecetes opilio]|uniref:Uncharacterized protein n=1 Tax=Chionoecetes opilio TaxID=41210 RepID=A0A8J5CSR7_CHIOP|nr:hypothetical protein GWK47_007674 [Chionoecetes opilio]
MRPSRCSRLLLLTLITLALLHAAASFMCYNERKGKQYTGVGFCETGICYVGCGRSMRDSQDDNIGCTEESHDDGCYDDGPGSGSGLTCYCSSPLCNTVRTCPRQMYSTAPAYTPSMALPLLLLPPMLHYLL